MVLREKRPRPAMADEQEQQQPLKKKQRTRSPFDCESVESRLVAQCLCGVRDDSQLDAAFDEDAPDCDEAATLARLARAQLLLDVYLKQCSAGRACARVVRAVDARVRDERGWVARVFALADCASPRVRFCACRLAASFLVAARDRVDAEWLRALVDGAYARGALDALDARRAEFAFDAMKRALEWKDREQHPLDDGSESESESECESIPLAESESFDASHAKCLIVRCLERRWPSLVDAAKALVTRDAHLPHAESCALSFLELWESIVSVRANLSVVDTKPFYVDFGAFVELLRYSALPPPIHSQLLSLFNEALCYGSTLALQDTLPEETCALAHSIVRHVKDFRLLDEIRPRRSHNGLAFVGCDAPVLLAYSLDSSEAARSTSHGSIDKATLRKTTLLVLKSVAVTVKEMRCDSSDSSIDSSDYNAIQDMRMVERSIRDVLKKLDAFLKSTLDFMPDSPFSKTLTHLFKDQDDYLVESMVCTLDITVGVAYGDSAFPDLAPMLNPFATFVEFLEVVYRDSDVLLDYLVSNETCFLLYLLRFLKYARRNWSEFVATCRAAGGRRLDDAMAVLIRLRHQISRLVASALFPYNIGPVLRLLEACESLYEGNELS